MSDQDAQDYLDDLLARAVELTGINGDVAAIFGSMLACREAWTAGGGFVDAVEHLAAAPGATAAEVEQAAAGILALASG